MTQEELTEVSGRWMTPANWKWYTLKDITKDGKVELGDAQAKEKLISDIGTVPLILGQDLQDRKEIHATRYITQRAADALNGMLRGRALLIAAARESTMGRVGILDENQVAAMSHVIKVIYPNNQLINLDFLFYYFVLQQTRRYVKENIAPKSTSFRAEMLETAKVVVPPLQEQRRIVERIEILTHDVEMCLSLLAQQRDDTLTIIALALRKLFSQAVTSTWKGRMQGEALFRPITNLHSMEESQSEDSPINSYLYIHTQTLEPFTGRLLDLKSVKTSELPAQRSLNILGKASGVLLYTSSNNGSSTQQKVRVSHLPENQDQVACHSNVLAFVLQQQEKIPVLHDFLFWSLFADTLTTPAGKRLGEINITKATQLMNAVLPYPEHNEQTRIVNHLNALREGVCKMRAKQDEEKKRLDQIKQTILEKAFRGML